MQIFLKWKNCFCVHPIVLIDLHLRSAHASAITNTTVESNELKKHLCIALH